MAAEIRMSPDALLASIVRSSDDAAIGLGLDGVVLAWNAGAERLFRRREQDVLGRPLNLLPSGDSSRTLAEVLRRVRTDSTTERVEIEYGAADGRCLELLLTISPIRDVQDRLVGVSVIARDVTARAV